MYRLMMCSRTGADRHVEMFSSEERVKEYILAHPDNHYVAIQCSLDSLTEDYLAFIDAELGKMLDHRALPEWLRDTIPYKLSTRNTGGKA